MEGVEVVAASDGHVRTTSIDGVFALEPRVRQDERGWFTRTLDLDLILYDDAIIDEAPSLIVPHPRFRERRFVLGPLAEIAPDWHDPVTGKTVEELLRLVSG